MGMKVDLSLVIIKVNVAVAIQGDIAIGQIEGISFSGDMTLDASGLKNMMKSIGADIKKEAKSLVKKIFHRRRLLSVEEDFFEDSNAVEYTGDDKAVAPTSRRLEGFVGKMKGKVHIGKAFKRMGKGIKKAASDAAKAAKAAAEAAKKAAEEAIKIAKEAATFLKKLLDFKIKGLDISGQLSLTGGKDEVKFDLKTIWCGKPKNFGFKITVPIHPTDIIKGIVSNFIGAFKDSFKQ